MEVKQTAQRVLWRILVLRILRSEKKLPLYAENSDPVLTRVRKHVSSFMAGVYRSSVDR